MGSRLFELPELKLLVDAVESSRFITKKKSDVLIHKLASLASQTEAVQLTRPVYMDGTAKPENETIYYVVDVIHTAIQKKQQIEFQYIEYTPEKKKILKHGRAWYRRCTWARNGKKRIVWRCVSRLEFGTKYCHSSPSMEEGKLHRAILEALNEFAQAGSEVKADMLDFLERRPFTTLFIAGNHENYDALRTYPLEDWHGGKIRRIRPSVLLLERGQVFDVGGKRIFAMGGASSHDVQDGILEPDDPQFLQKLQRCRFRYHFFGHYHGDLVIRQKYVLLYEQILRLK